MLFKNTIIINIIMNINNNITNNITNNINSQINIDEIYIFISLNINNTSLSHNFKYDTLILDIYTGLNTDVLTNQYIITNKFNNNIKNNNISIISKDIYYNNTNNAFTDKSCTKYNLKIYLQKELNNIFIKQKIYRQRKLIQYPLFQTNNSLLNIINTILLSNNKVIDIPIVVYDYTQKSKFLTSIEVVTYRDILNIIYEHIKSLS